MPREFSRNQRLGHEIMRALSELLHSATKDPSLRNVSLTSVDLSRDLSVARVYFSMLDPAADPAPVLSGLGRANGFLRSKLGRAIKIRHVPELRFVHDDSAEQAVKIGRLIDLAIESGRPDPVDES